jgi:poly [ADP-ribose] polymerase
MKIKSSKFGTHPFPSDYDVVRTATLNKTDLSGGNNKFYIIEAHVSKSGKKFRLYSRYGRVGKNGQQEERIPDQSRAALDAAFDTLLKEKTSKRKGYVEVKVAQSAMGSAVAQKMVLSDDVKKDKVITSGGNDKKGAVITLHPSVVKLVDRLFAEAGKAVRRQLSGTLQTSAENPLGTLTLTQIEDGRSILQEIQQLLTSRPSLKGSIDKRLLDLSNRFYSAIPQQMAKRPRSAEGKAAMDRWLKKMALNDEGILDDKEDLLQLLSDVQGTVGGFATSDTQARYREIGCQYDWLDPKDPKRKKVESYMQKSRSRHHDWKCKVLNVWGMSVKGQRDAHVPTMKEVGNIKPLFHGSGPQNVLGICKHGLLMRPPGVYITGSMFGNGLYFADQSSKSEQYAFGRFGGGRGRGQSFFMFVTDVALGKIKKYQSAQTSLTKPPRGYNSVQGQKGSYLLHNEFIVYSLEQHILQYLVEFQTSSRGYY